MEISTTQKTNYIAFAGVIVMLAGKFGFDFQTEDVITILGAIVSIYGIVKNYINRYKKGDVSKAGFYLK